MKYVFLLLLFLVLIDIDECTAGSHNCHSSATCNNTVGSFNCTCNNGYSGDGTSCIGTEVPLTFNNQQVIFVSFLQQVLFYTKNMGFLCLVACSRRSVCH